MSNDNNERRAVLACGSRGRDKTNPSYRGKSNVNFVQTLEIGSDISNCLSTVQKDSMVVIIDDIYKCRNPIVYEKYSPTLRAERGGLKVAETIENEKLDIDNIRIRKLTPKECWRLMDFEDSDFDAASQVCSNSQLYKQAGNSIVVNCLVAVMGQLFEGKEEVYKDRFCEKED